MSDGITDMMRAKEKLRNILTEFNSQCPAKYEIKYADYSESEWTAPVYLTDDRISRIVDDNSVTQIRLTIII